HPTRGCGAGKEACLQLDFEAHEVDLTPVQPGRSEASTSRHWAWNSPFFFVRRLLLLAQAMRSAQIAITKIAGSVAKRFRSRFGTTAGGAARSCPSTRSHPLAARNGSLASRSRR